MRDEALQRAIDEAGGVAQLASAIGVSSAAVSQWRKAPPARVLQIEAATGGKVSRHDLRPDFYPVGEGRDAA